MNKKNIKELVSRFLPIVIWAIIIFSLSADPEPYSLLLKVHAKPIHAGIRINNDQAEKIGNFLHVFEYGVLSVLVSRGLVWKSKINWDHILLIVISCSLFALSDEVHQIFIPGRAFELTDLARDLFGIIMGIGFYYFLTKNKP